MKLDLQCALFEVVDTGSTYQIYEASHYNR